LTVIFRKSIGGAFVIFPDECALYLAAPAVTFRSAGVLVARVEVDQMPIKAGATTQAREAGRLACMAKADARAVSLAPIIAEIRASGITTPYAIAAALTARGIPTATGRRFWLAGPVRSLLSRLDRLSADSALGVRRIGAGQGTWPASATLANLGPENQP